MPRPRYGGRGGNPRDIVKWWRAKTDQIEGVTEEALEAFSRTGAESMIYQIATDTKTKASRERGGGRVGTGKMISDVEHNVTTSGKGRKTARFGWLGKHGANDTMYYLFQEGGFQIWNSNHFVEGMYAQERAGQDAITAFRAAMKGLKS